MFFLLLVVVVIAGVVAAVVFGAVKAFSGGDPNRVPCPACGKMILTPVDVCPKCGAQLAGG